MKKRLAVIVEIYPAKTEKFIYRGLRELKELGVDITLYYMKAGDGEEIPGMDAVKVPSIFDISCMGQYMVFAWKIKGRFFPMFWDILIRSGRIASALYHFLSAVNFARIISGKKGNIHVHAEFAGLPARYARYASYMLGLDYTISAHAQDILVHGNDTSENLRQALFIIFCTEAVREHACMSDENIRLKSEVIYHGIPSVAEHKKYFSKDIMLIISAGRFVEKKGFEYLIKACRILADEGITVQAVIAGEGERRDAYAELVKGLALEKVVGFPGFLAGKEVEDLFRKADVLCVPSVRAFDGDMDGIPNVILEAALHGVPTVASDLKGIGEIVTHGKNGIMVQPGSADELAKGLKRFYSMSKKEKDQMSKEAYKVLQERFNIKKNMKQWIEVFKQRGIAL